MCKYNKKAKDKRQKTKFFLDNSQQTTDNSSSRVFSNVVISEDGDIYLTDVKNYVQNGEVVRYTSNGEFVTSFEAGIVPGAMMFN